MMWSESKDGQIGIVMAIILGIRNQLRDGECKLLNSKFVFQAFKFLWSFICDVEDISFCEKLCC